MTDFYIKQNDTRPSLVAVLTRTPFGGEEEVIDLTTAEAVFFIARSKGAVDPTSPTIRAECTIVEAEAGEIRYDWIPGDTAVSGEFNFEFEIVWSTSEELFESIPRSTYYALDIVDDLG